MSMRSQLLNSTLDAGEMKSAGLPPPLPGILVAVFSFSLVVGEPSLSVLVEVGQSDAISEGGMSVIVGNVAMVVVSCDAVVDGSRVMDDSS